MKPQVGIAIAAHDAESSLERAIESVLAQTDGKWRLAIVDDGSTDDTSAIAQKYASQDSRIMLALQENAGAAVARNTAFSMLNTEWIAYLDADDELSPVYVAEMLRFMEQYSDYDFYSCNGLVIMPDGVKRPYRSITGPREITLADMFHGCQIISGGTLQRKSTFLETKGFNPHLRHAEDYCYWLSTMAGGKRLMVTDKILYFYYANKETGKSHHIYGKINASAQIQEIVAQKELSSEERCAAQEGIISLRMAMARDYWTSDDAYRAKIINDGSIDQDIKQMLAQSRRVLSGVYAERIQEKLNKMLGVHIGGFVWRLVFLPYRIIRAAYRRTRNLLRCHLA